MPFFGSEEFFTQVSKFFCEKTILYWISV